MVDAPDAPVVPLRRNRDFLLLWTGQVLSTVGTRISALAYPLLVLALTESPARAGLVAFAQTLPFLLLYLPAGALVDRWSRRRIMLVADGVRAIALGSVAAAVALGHGALWHIAAVAFVEGVGVVFFQLAEGAALPQIVPKGQLSVALAQNQARRYGADVAGQPLGGLLFGVSRFLPFLVDALTYAASFLLVLLIRRPLRGVRGGSRVQLTAEIAEGVRWLLRERLLRALVLVVAGGNLVFSALPLVLIVRARDLGASPTAIGVMLALLGVGAILGSLLAPAVQRLLPARLILVVTLWLWAAELAALAAVPHPLALGAVAAVGEVVGAPFNVVVARYRYALVPERLLGRVFAAGQLVAWGTIPLGALAAGLLLEAVDARTAFATLAAPMLVLALSATLARIVRTAPQPDRIPAPG